MHGMGSSSGKIEIWASNKEPYVLRRVLAEDLGISIENIKVHILSVGGDFGGKDSISDVPICYFLAARAGMPVKLVLSYGEELNASGHRHPAVITLRSAVKRDGTLGGIEAKVIFAGGAYAALKHSPEVTVMGLESGKLLPSPSDSHQVLRSTNHIPCIQSGRLESPNCLCRGIAVGHYRERFRPRPGRDPAQELAEGWRCHTARSKIEKHLCSRKFAESRGGINLERTEAVCVLRSRRSHVRAGRWDW